MSSKGTHLSEEAKERIAEAHRGKSTTLGFRHSEESKQLMSKKHKGHIVSEATRAKISQAKKGVKLSEEARQHISSGKKGKKHKPHKKGNVWEWTVSEERRKEVANIYKGRKYTDESKQLMSKNHHLPYNIIIDGKEYNSLLEASKILNIKYSYLRAHKNDSKKLKELFGIDLKIIDK